MARSLRYAVLVLLLALSAILVYQYRGHFDRSQGPVAEFHHDPILISGIAEPEEMRVEPFPAVVPNGPERMLREAMKEIRGNSDPNALLPALNRTLAKYPDYADGYVIRLGALCTGKDRAAILSDINNALKYESGSENLKETHASVLSMKAKTEHDGGDDTAAMRDLDAAIHADLADGARFANSGAVAPEKTAGACTWSETDMDQLKQRFPANYRSYLFTGLYYGFFSNFNEPSVKPALENLDKAGELNPASALPHFFKAHILQQAFFLKSLAWTDAQRAALKQQQLEELTKALALDPNLLPALGDRAEAYFSLKQFQQAIPDYQIEAMRLLDRMSNQCDEIRLQNELLFPQKRDAQPLRTPAPHVCSLSNQFVGSCFPCASVVTLFASLGVNRTGSQYC
jgi:tetratricopeptide (TPR) repeat protein